MIKKILPYLLPVLVIAVVAFGGMMYLESIKPVPEKAKEEPKGLTVFAERVGTSDLELSVEVQGEVRPRRQIVVAPQISGRVSYVAPNFVEGGAIRKGQILIQLEAADYELAVVRAQSSVASAEQRLLREKAEAEIALQDLEELGLENASPLARREPQLAEARASLEAANAQLKDAQLALKRTAVYAPFAGRVLDQTGDVGQFVGPGQSLGSIFATDVVEVSLPITDQELGRLGLPLAFNETRQNPGPKVSFTGNVGGELRSWTGRIVRTGATVNSQTRLISAIAELQDPYGKGADNGAPMAPGLFVNASIKGETVPGLLWAPRSALRGDDKVYVGYPEERIMKIMQVAVKYTDPTGVYMSSGVASGDLVITSPVQAAFDGMSVEVYERTPDGELIPPPAREEEETEEPESDEDTALVAGGDDSEGASQ